MNRNTTVVMDLSDPLMEAKGQNVKDGLGAFFSRQHYDSGDVLRMLDLCSTGIDLAKAGSSCTIFARRLTGYNGGRVPLFDAIGLVSGEWERDGGEHAPVMVIVTDGERNTSETFPTVDDLLDRMHGNAIVRVYVLGIGEGIDRDALGAMSLGRLGNFAFVDREHIVEGFEELAANIIDEDRLWKSGHSTFPMYRKDRWLTHHDPCVENYAHRLEREGHTVHLHRIPGERNISHLIDLYDETDDVIVIIVAGELSENWLVHLPGECSKMKELYGKAVRLVVLGDTGTMPEWFVKKFTGQGNELVRITMEELVMDSILPDRELPTLLEDVVNTIPLRDDPYGECKHPIDPMKQIVVIYPERERDSMAEDVLDMLRAELPDRKKEFLNRIGLCVALSGIPETLATRSAENVPHFKDIPERDVIFVWSAEGWDAIRGSTCWYDLKQHIGWARKIINKVMSDGENYRVVREERHGDGKRNARVMRG